MIKDTNNFVVSNFSGLLFWLNWKYNLHHQQHTTSPQQFIIQTRLTNVLLITGFFKSLCKLTWDWLSVIKINVKNLRCKLYSQGSYRSWKTWKVMEFWRISFSMSGKSRNFIFGKRCLEWAAYAWKSWKINLFTFVW